MEAREHLCSDIPPYIVVDTVRLLVKQQGVLCPSVLMKDCARERPAIAQAPITFRLEGEGAGEVGKPTFFSISWCVSFLFLKKKCKNKKNPTQTNNEKNPNHRISVYSIVFLTINRQNLFGLKSQAVPGWDPTTTAQYVGGSHMHTSYLSSPASLAASTMFQFVKPLSAIAGGTRGTAQTAHVLFADKS